MVRQGKTVRYWVNLSEDFEDWKRIEKQDGERNEKKECNVKNRRQEEMR